ncbi:MAG: DUF1643 domain-containing protein [Oscillospiraceae bacterium]|nr:DUF1643 domain-containing protein [Oscillospiraceae bacterium]
MHIPSGESQTVELLDFEEALARSGKSGGYDPEKWLYVPDFYTEYRYILGTRGKNPLICIGVNPSTAAPEDLDNTLKSVSRIAAGNGFDSWIMFNVYAQRATRPDDMDRELNEELHRENLRAFAWVLSGAAAGGVSPAVWAAWGAVIEKRPYLPGCVRDMVELGKRCGARWLCAGACSKKGHPHHPLYLRKDEKVRDFDIEGYLNSL